MDNLITRWWRAVWPFSPWRIVAEVDAADEVPDRLPRKGAVLVGSRQHPKWIAFDCPCGARHRILLPLDARQRRHWRLRPGARLTLWPSIDAIEGARRCHYFITHGRTVWARDEEP